MPSSTYAPILMKAGGITVTLGAMKEPRRTLVPPGTRRTADSMVRTRGGKAVLSMKGKPGPGSSTIFVARNPARIPCLTQEFTRHSPSSLGSAERIAPDSRPSNSASCASVQPGSAAASAGGRS